MLILVLPFWVHHRLGLGCTLRLPGGSRIPGCNSGTTPAYGRKRVFLALARLGRAQSVQVDGFVDVGKRPGLYCFGWIRFSPTVSSHSTP